MDNFFSANEAKETLKTNIDDVIYKAVLKISNEIKDRAENGFSHLFVSEFGFGKPDLFLSIQERENKSKICDELKKLGYDVEVREDTFMFVPVTSALHITWD